MTNTHIHPAARMYADEYRAGLMDRREFLSRTTMLGVTAASAYGLIGAAMPSPGIAKLFECAMARKCNA